MEQDRSIPVQSPTIQDFQKWLFAISLTQKTADVLGYLQGHIF